MYFKISIKLHQKKLITRKISMTQMESMIGRFEMLLLMGEIQMTNSYFPKETK